MASSTQKEEDSSTIISFKKPKNRKGNQRQRMSELYDEADEDDEKDLRFVKCNN